MFMKVKSKDRNPALHILSVEKILCKKADFLIRQIVEAASIKAAVTVGDNARLTSGKETRSISSPRNVCEVKRYSAFSIIIFLF
jgi:hypothetical protein